ncbi:MAG: adenylate/guanylate cyclase domain-containing protein [Desulfatiglandales bacterium]
MKCPKCQFDNKKEAKFCKKCGTKLELTCPSCGHSYEEDSLFCEQCGQRLDEVVEAEKAMLETEGERKYVTALFSDLSGYTAMSEKLDPEEVKEIMSRIFGEITQVVTKYEGFIEKFMGDAVMVLFGVPKAHEDDPIRAIKVAREIHELVDTFSPVVEKRIGQPISMHTGINTGLVVTGEVDMEKGTHGVTGDTINLASRLSSLAKAGEILIGPDSYRQAEGHFVFESLEPTKVKGKAKPITPYRVVGETKVRTRLEAAEQRGFTHYTGRKQELVTLHACLEKAMAGQGQFVTVVGEAGIGKSRLLFEFRHSLDRERITVLEGRCRSYGIDTPYLPMVNALRRGLDLKEEDSPARLSEKAVANIRSIDPALEQYLPHYLDLLSIPSDEYTMPKSLKGEDLRRALQKALVAILTLNTRPKPMVVIFEDWHWADEASDLALKHLVNLIASYALMLVVLCRPEYKARWGSLEIHTPLILKPLGHPNTEDIVKSMFRVDGLPEGMGDMIHERTGGNPFFTEEVCNSLLENEVVLVKNRQVSLTQSLKNLHLPDTVYAVISTRFDRLEGEAQETLRLASAIGREFAQRILERITPTPEELSKPLEDLKTLDLIQQIRVLPEAEYIFKHVLTQVVIYKTLLFKRRKELHGLVGQAIEELYADRLEEHYEALAYHYQNSTYLEKAIHYLDLAGDKAARFFSLEEARRQYRAAIELLDSLVKSPETKGLYIALSLKWAEVSYYVASEEHLKILETSLKFAQDLQDETRLAKITYWTGRMHYSLGKIVQALTHYERCIEMAGQLDDEEMLALSYNGIGGTCLFTSEFTKGVEYLEKSIPMLERLGNLEEVAYSTGGLGYIHGILGNFEKAISLATKALEMSINIGNKTREAACHLYLEVIFLFRGVWKETFNHGAQSLKISTQIDNPVLEGLGIATMGYATFHEGGQQKGIDLIRKGMEKIEATGSTFSFGLAYGWLAEAHALDGHKEEAEVCANKVSDSIKLGERWGEVVAYRALAIMAAKGKPADWNKVDAHMGESLRLAEERGARPDLAIGCFRYSELLRDKDDLDQARNYLNRATGLFSEMEMAWWLEQAEELEKRLAPN